MSNKRTPPVVVALDAIPRQPDQHLQLHTDPERVLGVVIRFPTPVVKDRNPQEVEHPEESGFDRKMCDPLGRIVMAMA